MPFERYLRDLPAAASSSDYSYYYQDPRPADDDANCHYVSTSHHDAHYHGGLHFQIPHFMLDGPPVLAPGGGAEVLPAGLLDSSPDSFGSSWFANNGFAFRQIGSTTARDTFPADNSQRFLSRYAEGVAPRQQEPSRPLDTNYSPSSHPVSAFAPPASLPPAAPSPHGLYSASGLDVLSILSRVVNRPNPAVHLGPVDLSCSFVIVDVRRHDSPIVYASPTFCHLTGYSDREILGRNCRFLQSPTGHVAKGEPRRFSSQESVSYMRKLLSSSKECQTTLVNYRKDGQAFVNLVTVVPLRGGVHNTHEEADEIVYHVGFQVDLTEQPTRILEKLRNGNYHPLSDTSCGPKALLPNVGLPFMSHGLDQLVQAQNITNIGLKSGRHGQMMSFAASKELRNLISDPTFTDSVSISTGTHMASLAGSLNGPVEPNGNAKTSLTTFVTPPNATCTNRMSTSGSATAGSTPVSLAPCLSLLLLEALPDFVLVLSLKGSFLYVAPSVRRVLGYEPQDLAGRSISDICHPADLVPLMRELKEGSVNGPGVSGTGDVDSAGASLNGFPKSVDLLFRALPKLSTLETAKQGNGTHSSRISSAVSPPQSTSLGTNDLSDGMASHYVWLECRGRLYVEPGKGRKSIILSGRTRWMPVVRWNSVNQAGGVGNICHYGASAHGDSRGTAGSRLAEIQPTDPLEFWALLSVQGTFLVASASVRDVLGWGASEMIGRNIWTMVKDGRSDIRECVEAELEKLDVPEAKGIIDPPSTIVTTSLEHKELHLLPMRLVFYRTPRPAMHAPPAASSNGFIRTPLIHPLNNPLCPIVCQATVLCNSERQSKNEPNAKDNGNEAIPPMHSPDASLFEELEATRGSSWQYELQQLKFANQRLHEELQELESTRLTSWTVKSTPPSDPGIGCTESASPTQRCQDFLPTTKMPIPQRPMLHYAQYSLSAAVPSSSLASGLHEQDPPPLEWSSLAGANGHPFNPLKRSWHSEHGPTT